MIIAKKRIRSLDVNLPGVKPGTTLVFAVKDLGRHAANLVRAGFPNPMTTGVAVLPSARGPVSRFNAEGKYIVHRDRPKETVHHQRDWPHMEWHGPYQVEVNTSVAIPYKRFPRTRVEPPGTEFRLATTTSGELILCLDQIVYDEGNAAVCRHAINLVLEHFGECCVLDHNLDSIIQVEVKRLNWQVLPSGELPFAQIESILRERIPRFDSGKNSVFRNSLAYLNRFKPSFTAVGRAGFTGYVVFGFPEKNDFVCESIHNYNATYVFDSGWEKLSQLTKAEILDQGLQKDRIVHTSGWHDRVRKLLQ